MGARKILTTDLHLKHLYDEHFPRYQHGPGVEVMISSSEVFQCTHCRGTRREPCPCSLGQKYAKSGKKFTPVPRSKREIQPVCPGCQNTSRLNGFPNAYKKCACTQCGGSGYGWFRRRDPNEWSRIARKRSRSAHGAISERHFEGRPWYCRDMDDEFFTFI